MARPTKLVFSDNFNSRRAVWQLRGDSYHSGSTYAKASESCVEIRSSKMVLRVKPDYARRAAESGPWLLTGHVGTQGTKEFVHGYFEARMRYSNAQGALGCFWLQAVHPGATPEDSEVDINECGGRDKVWHNLYWLEPGQQWGDFSSKKVSTDVNTDEWHTYGLWWRPDGYRFYIDNREVARITGPTSSTPKFMVLSMLVRDYHLDELAQGKLSERKAEIDWVKVYQ